MFFGAVFCIEQFQSVVETFLACFSVFSIFDPKWKFWKSYSFCLVAVFGNFKHPLIFRILVPFWSPFCIEQLQCVVKTFLSCFFAFLIFDPKWGFYKGFSLCLVPIFGNFQNALNFRILAVFGSHFLHRTPAMSCSNVFSMFFCIFNFWPKVRILQGLLHFLGGHSWQFSKCSYFSNLSCFWEPFIA